MNYSDKKEINITEDFLLEAMIKLSHYNIGVIGNDNIVTDYLNSTNQYYRKMFSR